MSAPDAIDRADSLVSSSSMIDECIAMMEMAWRVDEANMEDFRMLQQVCHVTFDRLCQVKQALRASA